jgi:hypothetical protein
MIDAKVPAGLPDWMSKHIEAYMKSGGKEGHMYTIKPPGMDKEITVPALLLVTKGRKTGEKYLFPLFYGESGGNYVIVASKGGAPDHPGWYKNLKAHPRDAHGAERAKLWDLALGFWPPYADYQKKVPDREIPVVVLEPVA